VTGFHTGVCFRFARRACLVHPELIFAPVPWLVLFATIVFAVGNFALLEVIQRLKSSAGRVGCAFHHLDYGGYRGRHRIPHAGGADPVRDVDINAMNGLKMALVA
jgi:hypothetical protein